MLTALKVVAIIVLIGGLLLSGKGSAANIFGNAISMPQGMALVSAYMAAIAGAFWAYDGWNNITFIAGEIKNPNLKHLLELANHFKLKKPNYILN